MSVMRVFLVSDRWPRKSWLRGRDARVRHRRFYQGQVLDTISVVFSGSCFTNTRYLIEELLQLEVLRTSGIIKILSRDMVENWG